MSLTRYPVPQRQVRPPTASHLIVPPAAAAAVANPDWYWPIITQRRKAPSLRFTARWSGVPASQTQPPFKTAPVRRPGMARFGARRVQRCDPPWPQVPIPDGTPTWSIVRQTPRAKARPPHGRYVDPPWTAQTAPQPPAFVQDRRRIRTIFGQARKGRRFDPQWTNTNCPPAPFRTRVKPAAPPRGRRTWVVPDQVPVPVWPPTIYRSRVKPALIRRGQGHMFEPAWPQAAQPTGGTLFERTKTGVGL